MAEATGADGGNIARWPGVYPPMQLRTNATGGAGPTEPPPPLVPLAPLVETEVRADGPHADNADGDSADGDADKAEHAPGAADIAADIEVVHREFSDFYRANWSSLAQALTFAVGDRDLAVEVTDEAMARAYSRWRKLRGYDSPAAWVYRVGFNLAMSHRRRLAHRLRWVQRQASEATPTTGAGDPMPITDPAIRTALLDLAPQFRSVVVCRLLLDWSVAETATALGVGPSTVRTRLHRALQKLHVTLEHLR
jgi:RNA polymerase sigma-70 factor (ECF subfamily)